MLPTLYPVSSCIISGASAYLGAMISSTAKNSGVSMNCTSNATVISLRPFEHAAFHRVMQTIYTCNADQSVASINDLLIAIDCALRFSCVNASEVLIAQLLQREQSMELSHCEFMLNHPMIERALRCPRVRTAQQQTSIDVVATPVTSDEIYPSGLHVVRRALVRIFADFESKWQSKLLASLSPTSLRMLLTADDLDVESEHTVANAVRFWFDSSPAAKIHFYDMSAMLWHVLRLPALSTHFVLNVLSHDTRAATFCVAQMTYTSANEKQREHMQAVVVQQQSGVGVLGSQPTNSSSEISVSSAVTTTTTTTTTTIVDSVSSIFNNNNNNADEAKQVYCVNSFQPRSRTVTDANTVAVIDREFPVQTQPQTARDYAQSHCARGYRFKPSIACSSSGVSARLDVEPAWYNDAQQCADACFNTFCLTVNWNVWARSRSSGLWILQCTARHKFVDTPRSGNIKRKVIQSPDLPIGMFVVADRHTKINMDILFEQVARTEKTVLDEAIKQEHNNTVSVKNHNTKKLCLLANNARGCASITEWAVASEGIHPPYTSIAPYITQTTSTQLPPPSVDKLQDRFQCDYQRILLSDLVDPSDNSMRLRFEILSIA